MATPTNSVTRAQWGSAFNYNDNTRMPSSCKGVALHWEGTKMGTFAHSACAGKVRSIESFHTKTRGWAGIAYNALVCPHGYIFEGRGTKYRSAANGDVPKNNAHFAVCYLGGKGDTFTAEAKAGFIRAVQWLRSDGGAGRAVIGHRDVTPTECPGAEIEAWLKVTDFGGGTTAPKPPARVTAVWGKPETWKIGSVGPDITRLGQRLEVWAKALGLPKPYTVGPGPEFTETDRRAVEAFQRAQGWSGGDADGYPGPETFKRLAAEPPKVGPLVVSAVQNAGSYNATGAKSYKARTDKYIKARLATPVDTILFQEVGNGLGTKAHPNCRMRSRLDAGLKGKYVRRPGSDGRYTYTSMTRGLKHVAGSTFTAKSSSWFNKDDKQAAWEVYEKDGVRAMDVSFHLESDSGSVADAKRVAQMLDFVSQALATAKKYGVDIRNILFAGDTNSEGMVVAAMAAAGWRNVAKGTDLEDDYTFMGWDGRSRKRFDYGFVHETAAEAELVSVSRDTGIADHAGLRIERRLTAA